MMDQSQAHHTQPLVDRLLDLEQPTGVKVSPSGRHVIYSAAPSYRKGEHVKSALHTADYGKEHSARPLTSGLYNDRLPVWTPDEKYIIFLSDRAKPGVSCALYRLPFAAGGGEAIPLSDVKNEKEIESFSISPDGKYLLFVSPDEQTETQRHRIDAGKDAVVWGENLEHARLRVLRLNDGTLAVLDNSRHVKQQITWTSDSSAIVFVTAATSEEDCVDVRFEAYNIITKQHRCVADWRAQLSYRPFVFLNDKVYFLAGRNPIKDSTSLAVWQLDLRSGGLVAVTKNQVDCVKDLAATSDALAIHYLDKEGLRIELLTPGGQSQLTLKTQANMSSFDVSPTRSSDGRPVLAGVVGWSSSPDQVVCLRDDTLHIPPEQLLKLSVHGSNIVEFGARRVVDIKATSRQDNLSLTAYLYTAAKTRSEEVLARPTVVLIHGGPYGRVHDNWNPGYYFWHEVLFKIGYNVLCPNYRGSAGQGEAFAAAAGGTVGTGDYDDVLCLIQKGIQEGIIDQTRLIVGGWSQGGFLSYISAVRNGHFTDGTPCGFRFRGTICGAGVVDWDMITMTSDTPLFEAELAGGAPWASSKDNLHTRRGSAIWEVKGATDIPPVLILHGKEDARVPHSQAVAFHRACRSRSKPCEFVTYPRESHRIQERAHASDMLKRVVRFCEQLLGPAERN